ncbi:helix-turn-helix domain-containing protein [Bacillus niameyensis]|uniref:helix-turn-helix domain-containing protein n=1 Tax=Bacillus niameyensis TaxID=1522308 RepID=UPI000A47AB16|nr:helix-turn-helix transcriptional regulator [Bacillus niameyensis]
MELENIGVKIAKQRRAHNMTQEELGKKVSVSAQAVSKWEKGDSLPDLAIIVELANIFHCTTDYLLGRTGNLESLFPQIHEALMQMSAEEKISFLSEIITLSEVASPSPAPLGSHEPSPYVHVHLGPTGIGLWAKDRLICIATTEFLDEAIETIQKGTDFPLTLLPDGILPVLLALLQDMNDLKPDEAVNERILQSRFPDASNFDDVITECIELGFVDRVRGGYRLNTKADLAVRLLAIIHQTINKQAAMYVTMGNPSN